MIKKIITVYSPFSCGATDSAINVAKKLSKSSKRVCLLDWNILKPRIREKLKLKDNKGLFELIEKVREHELRDENFLRLFVKSNNFFVLTGLYDLNEIYHITEHHLTTIIETLKKHFEYIVVDVNSFHDLVPTVIATEQCDNVLLVTSGDLITLRETRRYLDMFFKYDDISKEKISILINNYGGDDLLKGEIKSLYNDLPLYYLEREKRVFKKNKTEYACIEQFLASVENGRS